MLFLTNYFRKYYIEFCKAFGISVLFLMLCFFSKYDNKIFKTGVGPVNSPVQGQS